MLYFTRIFNKKKKQIYGSRILRSLLLQQKNPLYLSQMSTGGQQWQNRLDFLHLPWKHCSGFTSTHYFTVINNPRVTRLTQTESCQNQFWLEPNWWRRLRDNQPCGANQSQTRAPLISRDSGIDVTSDDPAESCTHPSPPGPHLCGRSSACPSCQDCRAAHRSASLSESAPF